jgi:hypothetical protein
MKATISSRTLGYRILIVGACEVTLHGELHLPHLEAVGLIFVKQHGAGSDLLPDIVNFIGGYQVIPDTLICEFHVTVLLDIVRKGLLTRLEDVLDGLGVKSFKNTVHDEGSDLH